MTAAAVITERKAHVMEHIGHMVPMLVLAGLMAGWTAEAVSRGGGYGLITDMILGLTGSLLVGGIAWVVSREAGMLGMFVIGGAGAVLAVAGQRSRRLSASAVRTSAGGFSTGS
jgi:uncharacterized membrane protein YeaQ/YmgE (transglycosylase-associated protein family)